MVYGECGMLPQSVYCNVSAMCYINRLHHMPYGSIVKQVYNELVKLQLGFKTWVTRVSELVDTYHLDIDNIPAAFKFECKESVANRSIDTWMEQVQNTHSNHILRTYCNFKHNFGIEMKYIWTLSKTINIESPCLNWEPVRIPWQLNTGDTLALKRKLKTATVLFVMFSKTRDILLWIVPLTNLIEKICSPNWHA